MRIKDVYISKLYGIYNHRILLKPEGLTIIHGANGVGKTAILKCLKFLFEWDMDSLSKMPFRMCLIELDNGISISVTRAAKAEKGNESVSLGLTGPFEIVFSKGDKVVEVVSGIDPKLLDFSESIADSQPWLKKIRQGLWRDERTEKLVDSWELVEEYFPKKHKRKKAHSPFFDKMREQINVKLIDTNRLSALNDSSEGSTVLGCASDMVKQIRMVNADYARRAQKLDQTFPHRLIGDNNSFYSPYEVKRRLKDFEAQQAVLSSIGLLAAFEGPILPTDVDGLSDAKLEAISLFVQDSEAKLSAFDELSRRCLALLDLINNKFKNKTLAINKEYGLSIEDVHKNPIPLDALSSGEQHEIVITYGLLFKTPAKTLLLIDEPEISLHVAWQKSFIKDLLAVSRIVGFECLVATHSPFIVGDNYELLQSLDGEVDS